MHTASAKAQLSVGCCDILQWLLHQPLLAVPVRRPFLAQVLADPAIALNLRCTYIISKLQF